LCLLYKGLEILRPHVPKDTGKSASQVVIGSIQGDVHDIGKNIVKMMFDVAGWDVYDLGRDVPLENFVKEQLRTDSEVVAMYHAGRRAGDQGRGGNFWRGRLCRVRR